MKSILRIGKPKTPPCLKYYIRLYSLRITTNFIIKELYKHKHPLS